MHIHQHSKNLMQASKFTQELHMHAYTYNTFTNVLFIQKKKNALWTVDCGVEEDGGRKEQTAAAVQKNGCCESEM
jgi:hypothetical protein